MALGLSHSTVGKVRRELAPERGEPDPRDPAEQMREGLAARRSEGLRFDAAWQLAWEAIAWPIKVDADNWRAALRATEAEWRACYESRPRTAVAAQVVTLGEMREMDGHAPVERDAVLA